MKRGRRKERPALPPAPLTFAYPLGVPGSAVAGAQALAEIPGEHAGHVFVALRAVLAWAHGPGAAGGLLRGRRAEPWLDALVRDAHAVVLRDPDPERMPLLPSLAVLLADMSAPERADPEEVSRHCLNLSEWALTQDATGTVLAFAEAAALASPWSGRLAWVAGKLYRSYGRMREAEYWLKRASRLAVWTKDWEAQALSLSSLGNLYWEQGKYPRADSCQIRALRIAKRHRLRGLEAEVLHDLFITRFVRGDSEKAQKCARRAFELYGPSHPNIPTLAHDIATFWIAQGYYLHAHIVLTMLLTRFDQPQDRLRVLASAARAAGGCGEKDSFERLWAEAWKLAQEVRNEAVSAAALTELGFGALSLSSWHYASEAFERAGEIAGNRGEEDVLVRIEAAMEAVKHKQSSRTLMRQPKALIPDHPVTMLVEDLVRSLREQSQP